MRKNVSTWKKSTYHLWLSLLLAGGAIFGVIDHWWNGELFLIGEEPFLDLMLGVTITLVIFAVWAISIVLNKTGVNKPIKQTN
jgi:hypothetical protein